MKKVIITEKPSVARDFANVLGVFEKQDGYLENTEYIITWCIGHLVTLSYPEVYDVALKRWSFDTLPFIPQEYKYETIKDVEKQFKIVKGIMNRKDIDTIYYAGDSAREGEYIQRLVRDLSLPKNHTLTEKRVWIDSQTEDEIRKGIYQAKPLSEYDALSDSAYMRAIEDYLIGINYSRAISIKYSNLVKGLVSDMDKSSIPVGRVMSCVLGMVTEKERSIRNFVKTPFYGVTGTINASGNHIETEWKAVSTSRYFESPLLYKETGFKEKRNADELKNTCMMSSKLILNKKDFITESKYAPLLFNLAELQNECSRIFKISPDETLKIVQTLYEGKLTTYPRTDARVITSAVAGEISNNISGLKRIPTLSSFCNEILSNSWYTNIASTKYTNDKDVSDHYAIIPTGQGVERLNSLSELEKSVFDLITKRFLSIFYPPAKYLKASLVFENNGELFFVSDKTLQDPGYLVVIGDNKNSAEKFSATFFNSIRIGDSMNAEFSVKESETSPPKPYTSGSIILAMENAGQLIEDEELRAEIKGSGLGTSATRAEIINKLVKLGYIDINKKTQRINSTKKGEIIYEVLRINLPSLLSPALTANWEKGLSMISKKEIQKDYFYQKLIDNIHKEMNYIKDNDFTNDIMNNCKQVFEVFGSENKNTDSSSSDGFKCPVCGKNHMIEKAWGFGCSGYTSNSCKFTVGFNLGDKYGVKVSKAQIKKLIKTGKTDFYDNLKGNKGNFKARFAIKDNGIIGFEFEQRRAN